jgi:hypothetical protein
MSASNSAAPTYRVPLLLYDCLAPNVVRMPLKLAESKAINHGLLSVPHSLARRVNLKLDVELNLKWRGRRTYKRLRAASILVSCPNPEQAELFIEAIHAFAKTLDGLWLAPRPEEARQAPTPGPKPEQGGQVDVEAVDSIVQAK